MALNTWQYSALVVYDDAVPFVAGTKVLVVTGGAGWDAHSYNVQATTLAYNLGPPHGVRNILSLDNSTGAPAAAFASGGAGYGVVNGTRVVFDGNSLTAGDNIVSPADYYPRQCIALLGPTFGQSNFGVGGQGTPQMSADAATQIDPLGFEVLVAWEIGNDLAENPVSAATAVQNFRDYCTARKAAGYRVVVLTVTPRVTSQIPPGWDAARLEANSLLREDFASPTSHPRVYVGSAAWADVLVDVASNPSLIDATDATYYTSDHIHLTPAGAGAVAADVANGILTAQSLPPPTPTFTSTPANPSPAAGNVSFAFTSAGATSFECSLDGGAYATCTSPQSYTGLAAGAHTFAVRAVNAGGTSSPASYSWTVSAPPLAPGTAVLGAGVGLRRGGRP